MQIDMQTDTGQTNSEVVKKDWYVLSFSIVKYSKEHWSHDSG
jgi:hypothetical protein